jgi:Domain of unknown function (DUF4333)
MADKRFCFGALVSILCVFLASGCGSSSKSSSSQSSSQSSSSSGAPVTAAQYESKLKDLLSGGGQGTSSIPGISTPSPSTNVQISAVTCPANLKPASGSTFNCKVSGAGGLHGSVAVTPTDSTGRKFNFKANLTGNGVSQQSSGNSTIG